MSFINYATEATETVTRDWANFFKTVNDSLAVVSEFSARGFGSAVEGDKGVPKGEGWTSLFRTSSELSSNFFEFTKK